MFFVGLVDFQDYIIFCHAFLEIKYICIKLTLDVAVYENENLLKYLKTNLQK